jgi:aminopeptidase C
MTGTTIQAVQQYETVERKKAQLQRAEYQLTQLVVDIPDEDFAQYMEVTEVIREKVELTNAARYPKVFGPL